jgi:hypothetical protein
VVSDFDRAREAAKPADQALARGETRLSLGLPITVKEYSNVAELPTTWGNPRFKDWRPGFDSLAVIRLKAAGAVILGKTDVPFMLEDWQSYSEIYGTTNNPWDLARTLGRSSGGARGGARRRLRRSRTRLRHCRLVALPGAFLRRRCLQADARPEIALHPQLLCAAGVHKTGCFSIIGRGGFGGGKTCGWAVSGERRGA